MTGTTRDLLGEAAAALRAYETRSTLVDICGTVGEASASHVILYGLSTFANIGDLVAIDTHRGVELSEVAHIDGRTVRVIPFSRQTAARLGDEARLHSVAQLRPDDSWLGRVVDPMGHAIDDGPPIIAGAVPRYVDHPPPKALDRNRVTQAIKTNVKAIDLFTPLCAGQRVGLFAGSGVGKSTLLAMLSTMSDTGVVVLALVGERGREVREFLEDVLGDRRHRLVAVVATGDDSPAMRRQAPKTAMTIAEHFRDRGEHVLLLIDSLTRFAHALREYALACAEPPVARGYPPSVFAEIARLLERGGPGPKGSGDITTLVTVLVDGDDHNDPVADAARGILDGHIVLDRRIAAAGRWPAIDVLSSLSRLGPKAWLPRQAELVTTALRLIARYEETKDLRLVGGYQPGADPVLDRALTVVPRVYDMLRQSPKSSGDEDPYAVLESLLKASSADPSAPEPRIAAPKR